MVTSPAKPVAINKEGLIRVKDPDGTTTGSRGAETSTTCSDVF